MNIQHFLSRLGLAGPRPGGLHTLAVALALITPTAVPAQAPDDAEARMTAQRQAMDRLAAMDGTWRGTALIHDRGETKRITQTERVGTLLDGTVRLIEGRGYDSEGALVFNAFAVLSYDSVQDRYSMRSSTQGRSGDFDFEITDDGFAWELPAGRRESATKRSWTEKTGVRPGTTCRRRENRSSFSR